MKKIIIVLVFTLVLIPATTYAAIRGLPDANVIYQFRAGDGLVEVFDDQDNKCYIAYSSTPNSHQSPSISCVKR